VRSLHHKVDLAIFEAIVRQAIPCHFLKPDPVLAEIAGSLLLRLKFRLQAAGVARRTVFDLKKDRLLSFFEVRFWRGMRHRLFLYEGLTGQHFEDTPALANLCGLTVTPSKQNARRTADGTAWTGLFRLGQFGFLIQKRLVTLASQ
jgi:hypothetical protein